LSCHDLIASYHGSQEHEHTHGSLRTIIHYTHRPVLSTLHSINLTVCDLFNHTLLVDMDVQPLGLVVHGAHRVGLENAVFLGEVGLRECLATVLSAAGSP
jgi:hypothetical protein